MNEFFFLNEKRLEDPVGIRALFYGEGVFETFRWKNSRPVFVSKHLDRLRKGAEFLGIPFPGEEKIMSRVAGAVSGAGGGDFYVKVCLLSEGDALFYAAPSAVAILVAVRPSARVPESASLCVSQEKRPAGGRLLSFKTLNYLRNVLAKREAVRRGFDDLLFLNADGAVTETSSRNVFWVKGKKLFTPSLDCGLLPGVTREVLLQSAGEFGYETDCGRFSLRELLESDYVFLTSSTAGSVYVDRVDGTTMPPLPESYAIVRESLLSKLGW